MKQLRAMRDVKIGFPMWRTRPWLLEDVFRSRIGAFRPDVVITQLGGAGSIANWALSYGVRPIIFLRDIADVHFDTNLAENASVQFFSNSMFTASWAKKELRVKAPVIYPPVDVFAFRPAGAPRFVTLINPIREKGVELVLSLAERLPHIPFLLVESWPLSMAAEAELKKRVEPLGNVTFWRRVLDMQRVYDVTRLLLVPSLWPEPFGRVVIEAQACRIPVIARAIGGVQEAVGRGGILLAESTDSDEWAHAVETLLADRARLAELSNAAVENARTGPWIPSKVLDSFEAALAVRP